MKIELEEKCMKIKFKADLTKKNKIKYKKNIKIIHKDFKPLRHVRTLRY